MKAGIVRIKMKCTNRCMLLLMKDDDKQWLDELSLLTLPLFLKNNFIFLLPNTFPSHSKCQDYVNLALRVFLFFSYSSNKPSCSLQLLQLCKQCITLLLKINIEVKETNCGSDVEHVQTLFWRK